jgi:hypothetical protein
MEYPARPFFYFFYGKLLFQRTAGRAAVGVAVYGRSKFRGALCGRVALALCAASFFFSLLLGYPH